MMSTRKISVFLSAALACGFAVSAMAKSDIKVSIESVAAFDAQVSEVKAEMSGDGRFSGVGAKDRDTLDAEFARIRTLLERKFDAGKLSDRDQVDLANAQERANAILTRNDGDRLICTWERRSGSNFKYKSCMTVSQRDAERRRSQEGFQNSLLKGGGTQMRGN